VKFTEIISSELDRAILTSKEIMKYHETEVRYDSRLREKSAGVFEGKTLKEYKGVAFVLLNYL
jgi:broad specificity phosphatase PhoE